LSVWHGAFFLGAIAPRQPFNIMQANIGNIRQNID